MSVDNRIPKQSFVSVTPEKWFGSDVLVFVFLRPVFIGNMGQMFSVFGVIHFDKVGVDSSSQNSWGSNKQRNFLPQGSGVCGVVFNLFNAFSEGFGSSWVWFVSVDGSLDGLGKCLSEHAGYDISSIWGLCSDLARCLVILASKKQTSVRRELQRRKHFK